MSAGYASRLSEYENKGVCGLPERTESSRVLKNKLEKFARLVRNARRVVVLTGAGVSTSAGIPDFRGPQGIWTLEEKERKKRERDAKKRKRDASLEDYEEEEKKSEEPSLEDLEEAEKSDSAEESLQSPPTPILIDLTLVSDSSSHSEKSDISYLAVSSKKRRRDGSTPPPSSTREPHSFAHAKPTLTHRAITYLANQNIIRYCITQNVDGLHRRSGLPRNLQSVLHGCVFTEKCEKCNSEHFRDFDVGGVSFQKTGRKCEREGCDGDLRDTILDWEDELPEYDFGRAMEECDMSDLCICLGTSLRIEPAGSLPTRAEKFVIVNMQPTPYDGEAALVIKARVDYVMQDLMERLGYKRWDDE